MSEEIDANLNSELAAGNAAPAGEPGQTPDPASRSALRGMMEGYFLEYASYVIKDRAIPHLDDGLKPVQRRIMHTLWEADDGKFHKVANIVGSTMKYHPHGDASIYSALVTLANKEYFIDKQGNFGNLFTGDVASAARYIECRLTPLAREVLFNPEITAFEPSYDGRNQEPVTLPAKVPVLLMQGTEGIAVGMATRVLPHNFKELLQAQIDLLEGRPIQLYPDFFQGGIMDASEYADGRGKVRLRAVIEVESPKKLIIREIPATTTTESLIASIEEATQKGKLKLASINDYTTESVEIELNLPRGVEPERTIKALYAYTQCEVPISVNCLVIQDNRPCLKTVTEVLTHNTRQLQENLERELQIQLAKLEDQVLAKTLAQIFIENRIYKKIEECETQEAVYAAVYKGLKPFLGQLRREVRDEDVDKLLQLAIRRISLFDINRNKEEIAKLEADIAQVQHHLAHLKRYTIAYIKALLDKYGPLYPRRTRLANMEQVDVRQIALNNVKVGFDRGEGYLGTAVKSDDPLVCTEFDRLVVIKWDGSYKVIPIPDKLYVGPVCEVFKANKSQVYSMIYRDKKTRVCYAKRFRVDRYIMDKEYPAIPANCKVDRIFDRYGVVVNCEFEPRPRQRVSARELDFESIPIRGAGAKGLKIDNTPIAKFLQVKRGSETPTGELAEESLAAPAPLRSPSTTRKMRNVLEALSHLEADAPQRELAQPATLPSITERMAAIAEDESGEGEAGPSLFAQPAIVAPKASAKSGRGKVRRPEAPPPPPAPPPAPPPSPAPRPRNRIAQDQDFELD